MGGLLIAGTANIGAQPVFRLDPGHFPSLGRTDERYQSYNIDLSAVTGSAPRSASGARTQTGAAGEADAMAHRVLSGVALEKPLDLADPRLRMLAKGLGPAYLRVSGTAANSVWFQDNAQPRLAEPPAGYGSVLTRAQWRGVVDFAKATDAALVTSFTVNTAVRDANGVWTPKVAGPLLAYTRSIGGRIHAAELFNEPNLPSYGGAPKGYDPAMFARDQQAFREFAHRHAPAMLLVGPGDVVTANYPLPGGVTGQTLMQGSPLPRFDVISYHFYPAVAVRCAPANSPVGTTPEQALTEAWLASTDASFQQHKAIRDRYSPGAPIWNTETAGAACSGAEWDATFLDSFRYLDQLGRLARQGASAVFHQTLVGGNYGLLDPDFTPRPNYWAALLWHRFMGSTVLDAGPTVPGMHLYAHCLPGNRGGVTVLAINVSDAVQQLNTGSAANVYTLSADQLQSKIVTLNGQALNLSAANRLPDLVAAHSPAGAVAFPARSISFVVFPQAANAACR